MKLCLGWICALLIIGLTVDFFQAKWFGELHKIWFQITWLGLMYFAVQFLKLVSKEK